MSYNIDYTRFNRPYPVPVGELPRVRESGLTPPLHSRIKNVNNDLENFFANKKADNEDNDVMNDMMMDEC